MTIQSYLTVVVNKNDVVDDIPVWYTYGFKSYKQTLELQYFEIHAKCQIYSCDSKNGYNTLAYLSNNFCRNLYLHPAKTDLAPDFKLPTIPSMKRLNKLSNVKVPAEVKKAAFNKIKRIKEA